MKELIYPDSHNHHFLKKCDSQRSMSINIASLPPFLIDVTFHFEVIDALEFSYLQYGFLAIHRKALDLIVLSSTCKGLHPVEILFSSSRRCLLGPIISAQRTVNLSK